MDDAGLGSRPPRLLTSLGFVFYVNHFGSYSATSGNIDAVIVLLT
jgi:hypothetical protein